MPAISTRALSLAAACLLVAHVPLQAYGQDTSRQSSVCFDFETGDQQGWQVIEGQFDTFVCDRPTFHHGSEPYNKQGAYFLSTLERKDGKPDDIFQGVAESPVFVLEAPRMTLLVGGGGHPETYAALCTLDGREVFKAHGNNEQKMHRITWDAPELVGQRLFLRLADAKTGSWGHITFDDFTASGHIDPAATEQHFAGAKGRRARAAMAARLDELNVEELRAAVRALADSFPDDYTEGGAFLGRLENCQGAIQGVVAALDSEDDAAPQKGEQAVKTFEALRREALLANPLVSGHPILFVSRAQYKPDHHNTATLFQAGEINTASFVGGGALKTIDVNSSEVKTLLEVPDGMVRDPDVSFDGNRILFSMRRNIEDDYHIYEMKSDGTGMRQLTTAAGVSDIDPLYLPDGSIVFSSTREPKFCMCNRHIMANLFRMNGDGANIHQIGKSTLFEGHGSLTPDGRILYDRWEYVDRNFGDAQGLWTANPDGTNHAVYWGNNTWSPGGVIDARAIPGTQQVICVFGSCHDRPWGGLAIIDRRLGLDDRAPVVRTWPAESLDLIWPGGTEGRNGYGFDIHKSVNPKYEDPYPLSGEFFLCSRMAGRGELMGIYLLDVFGNEILLHVEEPGCFDPMPLGPRPCPPAIPSRRDMENRDGYFYIADVYQGTHMAGVERGAVKYLRVIESPEKRFWTNTSWSGQGVHCPGMNWHDFNNKRILGTVPVEADGSAHFAVPADKFVYFQLLDEKGMMVQSMRSGVIAQSGELTGCVGCHDNRRIAPPPPQKGYVPLAMQREPSLLGGWHGEPRLFSYMAEVQPVFDANCVKCHDYGKKAGKKLILAPDRTDTFNTAYNELWRKKYIAPIGAGPAETQPAYGWGSHASKIVEVIGKGHKGVKLDEESLDRLVTWIDINAPYYPTYASAYPGNLAGRSPLDDGQLNRLTELTGVAFNKLAGFAQNKGPQISFDRPELSPCLASIRGKSSPEYSEAVGIIRSGAAMLKQRPRADMPGFQLAGKDAEREAKYAMRADAERRNREALREGTKAYDE
jgi:Hydrazine synthase alpha subunit middle domain/WD40-like Beta Propeller Repeat